MDANTWNNIILKFPDPHFMQSWQWGHVKSQFGWIPHHMVWGDEEFPEAAALILQRTLTLVKPYLKIQILYCPKGPLIMDIEDTELVSRVLNDLKDFAQKLGAIYVKIDPDITVGNGIPGAVDYQEQDNGKSVLEILQHNGWHYSQDQIQYKNTVLIDLQDSEDKLLARMKQKTRYNIRLSSRKGVKIQVGTTGDQDLLYRMYAETSLRDGFAIRDQRYYQTLWNTFNLDQNANSSTYENPSSTSLIAEVDDEPTAAVVIFFFANRAYYVHGMSKTVHREKMPNYQLQWEAITLAKRLGCKWYDLWGAPEVFNNTDPMWGVFRFKQGLGGFVNRTIGAHDFPVSPVLYRLYSITLPKLLDVTRRFGTARVKNYFRTD